MCASTSNTPANDTALTTATRVNVAHTRADGEPRPRVLCRDACTHIERLPRTFTKGLSPIMKAAKRKSYVINGEAFEADDDVTLDTLVGKDVKEVMTPAGSVISRSEFAKTPAPRQFTTNLTPIHKGYQPRSALLREELRLVNALLDEFEAIPNGRRRSVSLEANEQLMVVRNFPLPDGYEPDHVDVLLDLSHYPAKPPIGLYLLRDNNERIIKRIQDIFGKHIFADWAAYGGRNIAGFAWVCLHYHGHKWSFCAQAVQRGDNLRKFLEMFLARI